MVRKGWYMKPKKAKGSVKAKVGGSFSFCSHTYEARDVQCTRHGVSLASEKYNLDLT